MRKLFALLLCTLVAACSTVPPPADVSSPALAWRYAGKQSYASVAPGLGVSYRYTSSAGWVDVYVYDLGRRNWRTGIDDPVFNQHFQDAINDVRTMAQRGIYQHIQEGTIGHMTISGQTFRSAHFQYQAEGRLVYSMIILTARNDQLLKYRISLFAPLAQDVDTVARRFIEDNLRDDPTAMKT